MVIRIAIDTFVISTAIDRNPNDIIKSIHMYIYIYIICRYMRLSFGVKRHLKWQQTEIRTHNAFKESGIHWGRRRETHHKSSCISSTRDNSQRRMTEKYMWSREKKINGESLNVSTTWRIFYLSMITYMVYKNIRKEDHIILTKNKTIYIYIYRTPRHYNTYKRQTHNQYYLHRWQQHQRRTSYLEGI